MGYCTYSGTIILYVNQVCVRPADVLRYSPHQDNGAAQGFSNAFFAGSGSGDELLMGIGRSAHLVPVYMYDEEKGSRGKKLRFRLPTWCIWKVRR